MVDLEGAEVDLAVELSDGIHVVKLLDNRVFEAFLEQVKLSLLELSLVLSLDLVVVDPL